MFYPSHRQRFLRPASGFTIIELLIIIVIIGILMTLLLPSFGRARNYSRAVVGASNMRQALIATQHYADMLQGDRMIPMYLPASLIGKTPAKARFFSKENWARATHSSTFHGTFARNDILNWADLLYGYRLIASTDVFADPNDPTSASWLASGAAWSGDAGGKAKLSYGINIHLYSWNVSRWGGSISEPAGSHGQVNTGSMPGEPDGFYGPSASEIYEPSNTFMILDSYAAGDDNFLQARYAGVGAWSWFRLRWAIDRHQGFTNAGMADLSVRAAVFYPELMETTGQYTQAFGSEVGHYSKRDFGVPDSWDNQGVMTNQAPLHPGNTPPQGVTLPDGRVVPANPQQLHPLSTVLPKFQGFTRQPWTPHLP